MRHNATSAAADLNSIVGAQSGTDSSAGTPVELGRLFSGLQLSTGKSNESGEKMSDLVRIQKRFGGWRKDGEANENGTVFLLRINMSKIKTKIVVPVLKSFK